MVTYSDRRIIFALFYSGKLVQSFDRRLGVRNTLLYGELLHRCCLALSTPCVFLCLFGSGF